MEPTTFEGQRSGEQVLEVWRRHPWALAKPGFSVVAILLVIAATVRFTGASSYSSLVILVGLLVGGWVGGTALFRWWNGMYILTNERIIDVDQRSLFHRVVGELPIENIQDATYEVEGMLATFLNYGDVVVQTVGGATTLTVAFVEAPYEVQQAILDARNEFVKG